MAAMPETAYARDGDVHLAYQVVGDSGVTPRPESAERAKPGRRLVNIRAD